VEELDGKDQVVVGSNDGEH